jgi:hypothetical protein
MEQMKLMSIDFPHLPLSPHITLTNLRHLHCIKGGGGCQTQEKLVAYNAKRFFVVSSPSFFFFPSSFFALSFSFFLSLAYCSFV